MGISQRDCIVFFAKIMKQIKRKTTNVTFSKTFIFFFSFLRAIAFSVALEITERHKIYDNT